LFLPFFLIGKFASTIDQYAERLSDFLALHKAMHQYIEEEQKPVFYELAKLGKVETGFFDKQAMSFTYIARKTHERYMENREKQGLGVFSYKLASSNPRNPLNQANTFEAQIVQHLFCKFTEFRPNNQSLIFK
jgi:hypothetical protein